MVRSGTTQNLTTMPTEVQRELMPLLHCIDEAFDRFGEGVKQATYWRLENEYRMSRERILARPDLFSSTLDEMFGPGAMVVKSSIAKMVMEQIIEREGERYKLENEQVSLHENVERSEDDHFAQVLKEARSFLRSDYGSSGGSAAERIVKGDVK